MSPRKLLFSVRIQDCKVEAMRTSKGAGGQKRDKTSSAIRITHPPSGAVGFSQEHREQGRNKREAFVRMVKSKEFEAWHRVTASIMMGKEPIESVVEGQMGPDNIRVDVKRKGRWVVQDENSED